MVNVGKNIPYGWSIWEIESCPTSKSFSYEMISKSATFCRLGTSQIDFIIATFNVLMFNKTSHNDSIL